MFMFSYNTQQQSQGIEIYEPRRKIYNILIFPQTVTYWFSYLTFCFQEEKSATKQWLHSHIV